MTTKLEQEFFEAMGIEQPIFYIMENDKGFLIQIDNSNPDMKLEVIRAVKKGYKVIEYLKGYTQSITDTIVLKLEEVIIDKQNKLNFDFLNPHKTYYYKDNKLENVKWAYSLVEEQSEYEYYGDYTRVWNEDKISSSGDTRKDALLSLCIQLKDEIREEVKAVFNG